MRITFPERVFLAREFLCRHRQCFKTFPETPLRLAGHGRSSSRSARMSSHTSSNSGRSLPPSAKSASIWRSHAAFSRWRMNEASSANSPGESVSTASLISARLTFEISEQVHRKQREELPGTAAVTAVVVRQLPDRPAQPTRPPLQGERSEGRRMSVG